MITFLLTIIAVHLFRQSLEPPMKDNQSIGTTKIVEGVEYWNIGTLSDEDEWIRVGSAMILNYVNVYEMNVGYEVKVEDEPDENVYLSLECYDAEETARTYMRVMTIFGDEGDECLHNG